jgi:hypothetical protein
VASKFLTAILAYSAAILVIGCASSPRVKDVSECRYGENESELIDNLGIGSEIIFFRLGDNDYHYRSYVLGSRGTGPVYGLLFQDNKLSVMARANSLPFDECLELNESESWDVCFSNLLRKMEESRVDLGTEQFSEGVSAESAAAHEDAIAVIFAAPVYVIFWPIYTAINVTSAFHLEEAAECEKVPYTAISLYPDGTDELALETLNAKHPYYVTTETDNVSGDRRVIARTWACGASGTDLSPERVRFPIKIEVRFGFTGSKMNWLHIRLHPSWWKWGTSIKNETSEN